MPKAQYMNQSPQVYNLVVEGRPYRMHSINNCDLVITKKYDRIEHIDELEYGDKYFVRGIFGKLSINTIFGAVGVEENYERGIKSLIRRGKIYVLKKPKKVVVKNQGQSSIF